ncbi:uncharacterized protein CCOS01_04965 [Colletotrichum costaricense]|uniref:Uncharacterized protein n=1 Tax=Colletotrichum costaricense TaxID=1209916 RepID=A0AAJ0E3E3_9PEZI|nr:uncharacterized protein CCOS01_04965 [Colletotrichum costaricense]KAK1532982.1 hypothetical protein CCOS01_04965 [Colletotrichum costaricense]
MLWSCCLGLLLSSPGQAADVKREPEAFTRRSGRSRAKSSCNLPHRYPTPRPRSYTTNFLDQ